MTPWEFAPCLTAERIIALADIHRRARDSAARDAKPKLGDSLCAIGLTAYDRTCHALELASAHEFSEWLSVKPMDNHFNIMIGGIPIRSYRGDPDMPIPAKTLEIGTEERMATQLAFDALGAAYPQIQCLRFEVDKNERGFTRGVSFVFVDTFGRRFDQWSIPRFVAPKVRKPGAVKLSPISLEDQAMGDSADTGTK